MKKITFTMLIFLLYFSPNFAQRTYYQGIYPFKSVRIYGVPCGDFISVDRDFLTNILKPYGIPSNDISAANPYGINFSYMRKRLYINGSFGFSSGSTTDINDTLSLERNSQFYGLAIGHNTIVKRHFVLSPYFGVKFYRIRNITSQKGQISLANYFQNRDIDLRINQFVATVGLNFSFTYKDKIAYGFYIGYLQNIHKNALLYSLGNRIDNNNGSPIKHLNIGLGLGTYFN
jgi:hypothetical protein